MNLKPRETVNWFGQKLWPWPLGLPPRYTVFSSHLGLGLGTLLAVEDSPGLTSVLTTPYTGHSPTVLNPSPGHWGCHHTGLCPCVWEGESGCLSPLPGGWLRFANGIWRDGAVHGEPHCLHLPGRPRPILPTPDYSWWEYSWGRCSGCHFCKAHIVLTHHNTFDTEVKHCSWPCMPLKS